MYAGPILVTSFEFHLIESYSDAGGETQEQNIYIHLNIKVL